MLRRFSVNYAVLSIALDIGLTLLALWLAVQSRLALPDLPFAAPYLVIRVHVSAYLIVPALWLITFLLGSVYDPKHIYKVTDEFQHVTAAVAIAALLFAGVLYLFFREFSRWLFLIFVVYDLAFLLSWRVLARLILKVHRLPATERRVLIVGAGMVGQRVGQMIGTHHWMGLELVGYLDDDPDKNYLEDHVLGVVQDVRRVVAEQKIDDVVIALPQRAYGQINKLALALHHAPVNVRVVPDYFSLALYRATVEDFGGLPMINLRDPALNEVQRLLKRLFDLTLAGLLTLLALPALGLIALLVKLDSPGPVLFRQQRVGENGRIFAMYKFRSMVDGAEKLQYKVNEVSGNGNLIHKKENDPRVTRVGRLLRRTSLDELPQLFNVLKGDMSLVGPRPEMPWLVDRYEVWQRRRFAVPQGMTGWWQVNGRSDKPMHLHTEDDLYYIQNYSLWMDLYILLKTPFVVLRGKGAY
ncbi:MAG: exopolysaccharide biosynthesis polyprenyl glycosylphosphotransferase [Anaerolinea sp.]|nr:exopolysaccharide biosynthesis polyprenyl glycosylphosphotransferase [Anaerolinea sp.]